MTQSPETHDQDYTEFGDAASRKVTSYKVL